MFAQRGNRQGNYFQPVLDTIAVLPKDELAEMAEAFVNLTKFRRRATIFGTQFRNCVIVASFDYRGPDALTWERDLLREARFRGFVAA